MKRILVVEKDQHMRTTWQKGLCDHFEVHLAHSPREASHLSQSLPFDAILLGKTIPKNSETAIVRHLRKIQPELPVISLHLTTSLPQGEDPEDGNRFLAPRHVTVERLRGVIKHAIILSTASSRLALLQEAGLLGPPFRNLIGDSRVFRECIERTRQLCPGVEPVLFSGPFGSGRELVARHLHAWGPRQEASFIVVQGSLDTNILATTLFGSHPGRRESHAFRQNAVDLARGGSLFVNDAHLVADRVIRDLVEVVAKGAYVRHGDVVRVPTDLRLLLATTDERMLLEKLRPFPEFLCRIREATIRIPSLVERRDDIPLLAGGILAELRLKRGTRAVTIEPAVIDLLCNYPWTAHIAELRAALEWCVLANPTALTVRTDMLPTDILWKSDLKEGKLSTVLGLIERSMIFRTMKETKGVVADASAQLGISRRILDLRLRKYAWSMSDA